MVVILSFPSISVANSMIQCRLLTTFAVNEQRAIRIADLLSDFRSLQHLIADVVTEPSHPDDYLTCGWSALRQCALDGQQILYVAADTTVPTGRRGRAEQYKAELQQ